TKVDEWLQNLESDLARLVNLRSKVPPQEQSRLDVQGIEIQNGRVAALRYIAAFNHSRGNDQVALLAISKAVTLARHDAGVLFETARILRALGQPKQGLGFVLRAAEALPNNLEITMETGRLYDLIGDKENACKSFRRVLHMP